MKRIWWLLAMGGALSGCVVDAEPAEDPMVETAAHDHLTDHNWQLEIEGVTQGAFAEVSGLDSNTEIVAYEGRGLSSEFTTWAADSLAGNAAPRDLCLLQRGKRVCLIGAKVVRLVKGRAGAGTLEEIGMVIERLERG